MTNELREYTVNAPDVETLQSVVEDLKQSGSPSPETIPDREVDILNERPNNPFNTDFLLTEEEAAALRLDPRVNEVLDINLIAPTKRAFQTGIFNKTVNNDGAKLNWGLIRHIKETNVFGAVEDDPGLTYDYVLDGEGVDIVVVDSGVDPDHPEFLDEQGNSRVQQINWFAASDEFGTQPNGFYRDYDGHGTHVASVAAGNTYGWAKKAHIFSIKLTSLAGPDDPFSGLSIGQAADVLRGWHLNKNNGRPSIVINSWGLSIFWDTSLQAFTFNQDDSGPYYSVNGGEYRGEAWTGSTKDLTKGHVGVQVDTNLYAFPWYSSSIDDDMKLLASNGLILCNAAGNEGQKIDTSNGPDYNNFITIENLTPAYYYHRGGTPRTNPFPGFQCGSLGYDTTGPASSEEIKAIYTNAGPGVNIYAAGDRIMGAMSNDNVYPGSAQYYANNSFLQASLTGTSFAAPQVAGLAALLLQAHPNWSVEQVVNWLTSKSKAAMFDSGLDNDYQNTASIWGGENRVAYVPFGERKTYQIIATS